MDGKSELHGARFLRLLSTAFIITAICMLFDCNSKPQQLTHSVKSSSSLLPTDVPTAKASPPSPQQLFKLLSPSVFVIETLDADGEIISLGSGIAISSNTLITNKHVIEGGSAWRVIQQGRQWLGTVSYVYPEYDLCELTVEGLRAPSVETRGSLTLDVGERVYAIGAPEGLELTLSEGIVSGIRRDRDLKLIQTSAPISHGSSGGGLFDVEGKLIGITTLGIPDGQNLNFALPAELIRVPERIQGAQPVPQGHSLESITAAMVAPSPAGKSTPFENNGGVYSAASIRWLRFRLGEDQQEAIKRLRKLGYAPVIHDKGHGETEVTTTQTISNYHLSFQAGTLTSLIFHFPSKDFDEVVRWLANTYGNPTTSDMNSDRSAWSWQDKAECPDAHSCTSVSLFRTNDGDTSIALIDGPRLPRHD
jgi:hypothetical protein